MQQTDTATTPTAKSRQPSSPKASQQVESSTADLARRRAELEDQRSFPQANPADDVLVLELRERAAAKRREADGLDAEIATIDAQIGATERLRRQEAEQKRQEQLAAMRKQLADAMSERLQLIAEAEAGARQLAGAIGRVLNINATMQKLAHQLSGERGMPSVLNEPELVNRLGGQMASVMTTTAPRYRMRFGGIEWKGAGGLYAAADDWRAREEKLMERQIKPLTEAKE
jgi:hypothetical protein